ncbi:hypothetical protein [Paraburkholderia sartisoli]|uniref:hypothetical protein n=1 Tax=Paraburkholderia sartisoli TaxID=83784 RepID=UPI000B8A08DD|nr:hypothetical protein [Paraburkholderia sartisoli]
MNSEKQDAPFRASHRALSNGFPVLIKIVRRLQNAERPRSCGQRASGSTGCARDRAEGGKRKGNQPRAVGSLIAVARRASAAPAVPDVLPDPEGAEWLPAGAVSTRDVRTGAATVAENSNAKELVLMMDS